MRLRANHIAVSLVLLGVYASAQVAPLLFRAPAPETARVLPAIVQSTSCDAASELATLFDAWTPPPVDDVEHAVVDDQARAGVERLRDIARCDHTRPLPSDQIFTLFSAMRSLEAHALAEHRAGTSRGQRDAALLLVDGWALAQNLSHDTIVGALAGMNTQTALLDRLADVVADGGTCFEPALRAQQVRSRYVSPDLTLEREGMGPEFHAKLRGDLRLWFIWAWSADEARRATTELESVLALPPDERATAAEALAADTDWWRAITMQDWVARSVRSLAPQAAQDMAALERARDEAMAALGDCW